MLWLGCRPEKREEQDGELRRGFNKKLKEGNEGFYNSKISGQSLLRTTSVIHDSYVCMCVFKSDESD